MEEGQRRGKVEDAQGRESFRVSGVTRCGWVLRPGRKRRAGRASGWLCAGLATVWAVPVLTTQAQEAVILRLGVEGPIGPATAQYIARGVEEAEGKEAVCLLIELDTPGGLLDSTKQIVQTLLGASVPTVVYVTPEGASAASAGCFITMAAHVAAMTPATNIGAAAPVTMGGSPAGGAPEMDETMKEKMVSYTASYIESIAGKRKRNVEWAISAVRESASITAERALELGVIDLVAADREDLLRLLEGREVDGKTLQTAGAEVQELPMLLRERLFQTLWRPEVMFVLMLVAIYGIIGEVSNPGALVPGIAGVIALVLALYMSSAIPVNTAGLALIGLALILFLAEIFTASSGILMIGGVISFVIGSIMLFDHPESAFRLSLTWIIPAAVCTALFFAFVVGAGLRAQRQGKKTGPESMIGKQARVMRPVGPDRGKVEVGGEIWNAVSDAVIEPSALVEIEAVDGLCLKVKRRVL